MKIDDDHMYHGAVLLQIAEHPRFTAINTIELSGQNLAVPTESMTALESS